MTLYHWTLNRTKLKAKGGFPSQQDRHSDGELGVWLTDQKTGNPESIKPEMRIVIIEIPEEDIVQYEEDKKGTSLSLQLRKPYPVAIKHTRQNLPKPYYLAIWT